MPDTPTSNTDIVNRAMAAYDALVDIRSPEAIRKLTAQQITDLHQNLNILNPTYRKRLNEARVHMNAYIDLMRLAQQVDSIDREQAMKALQELRTDLMPGATFQREGVAEGLIDAARFTRESIAETHQRNPTAVYVAGGVVAAGVIGSFLHNAYHYLTHPEDAADDAAESGNGFMRNVMWGLGTATAAVVAFFGFEWGQRFMKEREERQKQEEQKKANQERIKQEQDVKPAANQAPAPAPSPTPAPSGSPAPAPAANPTPAPSSNPNQPTPAPNQPTEPNAQPNQKDAIDQQRTKKQEGAQETRADGAIPVYNVDAANRLLTGRNLLNERIALAEDLVVSVQSNPVIITINGTRWRPAIRTTLSEYEDNDNVWGFARNTGRWFGNRGRQIAGAAGRFAMYFNIASVTNIRWTGEGFKMAGSVLGRIDIPRPGWEDRVVTLENMTSRAHGIAANREATEIAASDLLSAEELASLPLPAGQSIVFQRI